MKSKHLKRIEQLATRYTWASFLSQSLDESIAELLKDHQTKIIPSLVLELDKLEQTAFSLLDRATARRAEALQTQGQAYLRASEYELIRKSRLANRNVLLFGSEEPEAAITASAMSIASEVFSDSKDLLGTGFGAEAKCVSDAARTTAIREQKKLKHQLLVQDAHEEFEDDVQALHTMPHGPFDYAGRYKKIRSLYVNDLLNFADRATHLAKAVEYFGAATLTLPPLGDPNYLWDAAELLQLVSRQLAEYRNSRITRNIALRVGAVNKSFPRHNIWGANVSSPFETIQRFDALLTSGDREISFEFDFQEHQLQELAPEMADCRLVAIAPQWIAQFPLDMGTAGPLDEKIIQRQNALLAYRRRYRVPTTLVPPPVLIPGWKGDKIYFPLAATTDEDPEQISAIEGEVIAGRPLIGRWKVVLKEPIQRGLQVQRDPLHPNDGKPVLEGDPRLVRPRFAGIIIHMRITGRQI